MYMHKAYPPGISSRHAHAQAYTKDDPMIEEHLSHQLSQVKQVGHFISCMSYEEEDTCMSYEEEDTCMSYEEEDTCMSYEEEDTLTLGSFR